MRPSEGSQRAETDDDKKACMGASKQGASRAAGFQAWMPPDDNRASATKSCEPRE